MNKSNKLMLCVVMLAVSLFCCGYISPNAGNLVIQMVIAASLGGLYAVKLFWKNIADKTRSLFGKKSIEKDPDPK